MLRYIISYNQVMIDNLRVIMEVMDFLINYVILTMSILFAFAFFAMFFYGSSIPEFSTFFDTILTLFGMNMGANEV